MPEYVVTDSKTNKTLRLTGDSPPTEQELEEIFSSYEIPANIPVISKEKARASDYAMEAVTAINRAGASAIDIATAPGQFLLNLAGFKVPTLRSTIPERGAFTGGGIATDIIAASGELAGSSLMSGAATRYIANGLSDVARFGESTFKNVIRSLGSTTPTQDLVMGAVAGAGGESVGEITSNVFGEDAKKYGVLAGQIISPAAWAATTKSLLNISREIIQDAAPSIEEIRGASRAAYAMLDAAGAQANGPSIAMLKGKINQFAENFRVDPATGNGLVDARLNQLLKAAEEGKVTYSFLMDSISELRKIGSATDAQGVVAREAAEMLDDFIVNMVPAVPESIGNQSVKDVVEQARTLWRRASVSQTIEDANNSALLKVKTGQDYTKVFKNEIRKILDPKNKRGNFFNKEEKEILNELILSDSIEKTLRVMSKIGFNSEDFIKTTILGSGATALTGILSKQPTVSVGGAVVASGVLGLTAISAAIKSLANTQFRRNANLAQSLIRSGPNAKGIVESYLKYTPADKRNPRDLTALLLNSKADISELKVLPIGKSRLVSDAVALGIAIDNMMNAQQNQ